MPKGKPPSAAGSTPSTPFGVEVEEPTADLLAKYGAGAGAVIASVAEDSIGSLLGLQKGDLVVALNGEKCGGAEWLRGKLDALKPATAVTVEFRRIEPTGVASYLTHGRL